ncbi:hypothetical protein [Mucilaginibacter sp.]|uniref:hypothetical protein n=1 Tax=Mucilaginibacter sp. TaxID=1882438 RepID=UPI0025FE45DA|nr:hypothetical protein [Mucilaginibacter sp.]
MNITHLTELEIQDYATDAKNSEGVVSHIESCESCKNKVVQYRLLFSEIKNSPVPAFNFNLSEVVLGQLQVVEQARTGWVFAKYLPLFVTVILLAFPLYFYRDVLAGIVKQTQVDVLCTAIVVALTVVVYQSTSLSKKFKRQMSTLSMIDNLQH